MMEKSRLPCFNRPPFKDRYVVQNGWAYATILENEIMVNGKYNSRLSNVRIPKVTEIPWPFKTQCMQWDKHGIACFELCKGCRWLPPDKAQNGD